MPLEVPNLDNQSWAELVQQARALIPRVAPLWTNHNPADPGITFVELFAWLAEMQLYRLNRVGGRNRELFARLAGIKRGPRRPARVDIVVQGAPSAGMFLPSGTQLVPLEGDEIVFETEADLLVTRSRLQRVIVDDGSGPVDQSAANDQFGVTFLAFGKDAHAGAEMRLGFDAFYADEDDIRLTANVVVEDLAGRCGSTNPLAIEDAPNAPATPPAELAWEYLGAAGVWNPLAPQSDETSAFLRSGAVTIPVPKDAQPERKLYWIRARIAGGYYDIEPRLRQIAVNVLPCVQRETVREELLGRSSGRPDQHFELKNGPLLFPDPDQPANVTSSQIASWDHVSNQLERTDPALAAAVTQSRATWQQAAYRQVNALSSGLAGGVNTAQPKTADGRSVASQDSTGLAQLLGNVPVVVDVDGQVWQPVSSFDDSGPTSQHYILDVDDESASIIFGNGLNGLVPARDKQIRALWYQVSAGASGNVGKNMYWKFRNAGIPGVTDLMNPTSASGGVDPESLNDLELRAQASLHRPERAVTLEDIKSLALGTPGVYVARAEAIPNCPTPEAITVVAVPKLRPGRTGPPMPPSEAFLGAVRNHLEQRRLLCDNLRVIGPPYIEVRVSAKLRVTKGASPSTVAKRANQALDRFLTGQLLPTDRSTEFEDDPQRAAAALRSPCPTRWPFGRPVFPSEVYAILDDVPGVDFASNVALEGWRGTMPVAADLAGAIPIPRTGLVFAGPHDLIAESEPGKNQ